MPTLTEKIDSREWVTGDNLSVTLHYLLDGTDNDVTARDLLLASTPSAYEGVIRDECTLEPIVVDTVAATGKWDCRVRYIAPENSVPRALRRRASVIPPSASNPSAVGSGTVEICKSSAHTDRLSPSIISTAQLKSL